MPRTETQIDRCPARGHLACLTVLILAAGPGADPSAAGPAPSDTDPPAAEIERLPDFQASGDRQAMKRRFLAFLRPIVESENARLLADRARLHQLYAHWRAQDDLSAAQAEWLKNLAGEYKLDSFRADRPGDWESLSRRVDVVPAALALAQAAIESAWGRSRFAREGNGIFGQWCYAEGRGIVPAERAAGAKHEVARFGTINQSVRSYMRNLNTHPAYAELRRLRAQMRRRGEIPDGYALAAGLLYYSQRREAYVEEVRVVIRANELEVGAG